MNRYSDQLIFAWRVTDDERQATKQMNKTDERQATTDTSQQYFNRGFNNDSQQSI